MARSEVAGALAVFLAGALPAATPAEELEEIVLESFDDRPPGAYSFPSSGRLALVEGPAERFEIVDAPTERFTGGVLSVRLPAGPPTERVIFTLSVPCLGNPESGAYVSFLGTVEKIDDEERPGATLKLAVDPPSPLPSDSDLASWPKLSLRRIRHSVDVCGAPAPCDGASHLVVFVLIPDEERARRVLMDRIAHHRGSPYRDAVPGLHR